MTKREKSNANEPTEEHANDEETGVFNFDGLLRPIGDLLDGVCFHGKSPAEPSITNV